MKIPIVIEWHLNDDFKKFIYGDNFILTSINNVDALKNIIIENIKIFILNTKQLNIKYDNKIIPWKWLNKTIKSQNSNLFLQINFYDIKKDSWYYYNYFNENNINELNEIILKQLLL